MLATKDNLDANKKHISSFFSQSFVNKLSRSLGMPFMDDPVIGNLVDTYGNIVGTDPAELAVAVFNVNDVLQKDDLKRMFIQPSVLTLTHIDGTKSDKEFIHGVYVEVPKEQKDNNKIRYHRLTVYGDNILVRINKLQY